MWALPISSLGDYDADIRQPVPLHPGGHDLLPDGEISGLSTSTPGMLVLRRSIAKAVLGTDDRRP